ncbi:subclass B3 metallo-beta-lactamase [Cytophagaceae bacterium DM2B3-1]|uniref:Subclass B3 metallo-beta-lactamase n=1 Tax=Xanthocytophaga flava TaxID=3048013 RepID=A0ABT7CF49_9BACT|nr:subclass B3 metallo-beta-lactamase [Xanthocytophaga flavus]MDJ1492141.1 subclass B3 metallo-beta-lactamase [Xanthocytophaga flavus]
MNLKVIFLLFGLSLAFTNSLAQQVEEPKSVPAEWSKPFAPFQIAGNLYYVGTYDLACYLITTSQGNILINTGLADSEPIIKANIETLGFQFADTKILLNMQAHYDHMGAMASIKKLTGAKLMINQKDAPATEDGGKSDYALGGSVSTFAPVQVDRLLKDRDTVQLGDMRLVMLHHPGHTKGSSSFLFNVKDANRSYRVLLVNMPTIVTAKDFAAIPEYPEITQDYAYTLQSMKKLSFDIWLTAHASQCELHRKHKPGQSYNPSTFIDKKGYNAQLNKLEKEFLKKKKGN